ncbi:MAG: hypothetical protein MZV65_13580 [Chromatiales bacterium]|nr:hypothetical protein [Chromatiales bacterium]
MSRFGWLFALAAVAVMVQRRRVELARATDPGRPYRRPGAAGNPAGTGRAVGAGRARWRLRVRFRPRRCQRGRGCGLFRPDGGSEERSLTITQRQYDIQRLNGLPPDKVTPPPALLERIRRENARVDEARRREILQPYFLSGFAWPATGRLSGVYGSQRILNGEPRQPHYGVDVAAPVGTPVRAPADGVVTLAEAGSVLHRRHADHRSRLPPEFHAHAS